MGVLSLIHVTEIGAWVRNYILEFYVVVIVNPLNNSVNIKRHPPDTIDSDG